jgi:phosphoribosylformylglycinamidine (FGAM) synthase PurS component
MKIVYTSFEVDADSYEEASAKLKESLSIVERILSNTILLDNAEEHIKKIISSGKLVNHAKI